MKQYYVYILTNKGNNTLYIGVTNDLIRRVYEHKTHLVEGFTARYKICKLVYFEETSDIEQAILREKYLKGKSREYKFALISQANPTMRDLYDDIVQ